MRELKQNPGAVVDQVLTMGQPLHITRHGQHTGVCIQVGATGRGPLDLVPGSVLNAMAATRQLTRAQAQAWQDDIDETDLDHSISDPWESK